MYNITLIQKTLKRKNLFLLYTIYN